MNAPYSDLLAALARCRRAADELIGRPPPAAEWSGQAADALLGLTPALRLALCHRPDAEPPTVVRSPDGAVAQPPHLAAALRSEMFRLQGLDGAAHLSPALGAMFGLPCLAVRVPDGQGTWAFLAAGTVKGALDEDMVMVKAVMSAYADALAVRRRLEAAERERDECAGFALAGQAVTGLAHEMNNVLNSVVLQSSVLQIQLDEKFHASLDVIRRQTLQATNLLLPLGRVSAERARAFYPVDLNRVVTDLLASDPALAARVRFAPSAQPIPSIRGAFSAIKQLIRLLLAAASADSASRLTAHTAGDDAGVQFIVDAPPISEADEGAADVSTAESIMWARLDDLERLAGQSLLRQLSGELQVAARPEGGFTLRLGWAAAPSDEGQVDASKPAEQAGAS
jgi:signal transduction histidine kinase